MLIYNLFPLLAGPISGWDQHVSAAADMGFDWIFVNPIHATGGSKSLYSIADYYRFDKRIFDARISTSQEEQIRAFIKRAHRDNIRVMADFVINHTATDAVLVQEKPGWYLRHANGTLVHPSADENGQRVVWGDLAQLNYHTPEVCQELIEYFAGVGRWLIGLGFDGFRCDAAYQVPPQVWKGIIERIRRERNDAVFTAETLGCTAEATRATAEAGFDAIFNSSKWWDLRADWLLGQYEQTRMIAPSISFPESHDTERLAAAFNGSVGVQKQRYFIAATLSSGVMMPMGYEYGFRHRLHVVQTRPEDWEEPSMDLRGYIRDVNRMKRTIPLLQQEGPLQMLGHPDDRTLVLRKQSTDGRDSALIICNRDGHGQADFDIDRVLSASGGMQASRVFPSNDELAGQSLDRGRRALQAGEGLVFLVTAEVRTDEAA